MLQQHGGVNAQVFEHPSNGKVYRLKIGICQDLKALMMNSGKSVLSLFWCLNSRHVAQCEIVATLFRISQVEEGEHFLLVFRAHVVQ